MFLGEGFKALGISAPTKGSEFIAIAIEGEYGWEAANAVFL